MKWALPAIALFLGMCALLAAVPPPSILGTAGFASPGIDRFDDSVARLLDRAREYVDEASRRISGVERVVAEGPRIIRGSSDRLVPAQR